MLFLSIMNRPIRNKLRTLLSCVLLLSVSCGKNEPIINQVINSTISDPKTTPWLGFGYNQHPIDRNNAGEDLDVWGDAHWNLTTERIKHIKPSLVRIVLYRAWFNPTGVIGDYNWDSPKMNSLFKVLDYYKSNEIPVMTGLWSSKITGTDNDIFYTSKGANSFQQLQVDLFGFLYSIKGYTNIKWYTPTNEPKGTGMEFLKWSTMLKNTFDGFSNAALPSTIFCGADSWDEWTSSAASYNKNELSGYDHHYYLNSGSTELISGGVELKFANEVSSIQNIDNTNKPVFLSEVGFMSTTTDGGIDYWFTKNPVASINPTTTKYGLLAFDYGIQVARSGESGALAWSLDGYDYGKDPGMWNIAGNNGGIKLRPWYYSWSLLCQYFPAKGIVYPIHFQSSSIRGVAIEQRIQDKSHWTFAFINWGDTEIETKMSVPNFKGGDFSKIQLSAISSGDGTSLSLPKERITIASLSDGFLLKIPPSGGILITSMDNSPISK
jgi:hypothetical protein